MGLYQQGFMSREEVPVKEGQRVFVVGGGNTAMDAARTSLRLGASEVTVLYHRTQDRMSALKAEYDDAVAEGVKFMFETSIAEIRDTNGDGELDELVIDTNGVKTTIPANRVIQAVGSAPASRIVSTTEGIDVDKRGYVLTRDVPYGMTSRKGVFAGGDVTNRPASVVHAMDDARKVAEGIAQYVTAKKLLENIESGEVKFNNA